MLKRILEQKNLTCYWLAKHCSLPYSTISDICNDITPLNKCRAEVVYKIAQALNMSMEDLVEPYITKRIDFDLFKSNVCHALKSLGDIQFLLSTLESDEIRKLANWEWYPESLYLLAMTDYISRLNGIPACNRYDDLRRCRLQNTVYPASVLALAKVSNNQDIKAQAVKNSIPEFIKFNIVESEIRNVI